LPQFERIRADIQGKLDKLVRDRLDVRHSNTSLPVVGNKLVTFKGEHQQHRAHDPFVNDYSTKTLINSTPRRSTYYVIGQIEIEQVS
jgi:hypothetical protein